MGSKWRGCKLFSLIVGLIINVVNFIANWMLYAGINNIQPGLVIGPYAPSFSHVVLGFCILSSLINIFEVYCLFVELFRKESWKCWLDGNTTSAMSIWLDDIPKGIIMILIVACHDMAISYAEVGRAILLLVTLVVRLIAVVVRDCIRRRHERHNLPSWDEVRVRRRSCRGCQYGAITLGLLFKLVAFCIIYFFTFFRVYPGGRVSAKQPSGILEPTLDLSRYLHNVSVFARVEARGGSAAGWLEVVPVMDMVRLGRCSSQLIFKPGSVTAKSKCGAGGNVVIITRSAVHSSAGSAGPPLLFELQFVKPSKSLLLGNIVYWQESSDERPPPVLKYFCLQGTAQLPPKDGFANMIGLVGDDGATKITGKVYGSKTEAEAIVAMPYCRRTGMGKCKMTGLDGPKLVQSALVPS